MSNDFYKDLDIEPSATHAEISRAYRRASLKSHPDSTNDSAFSQPFCDLVAAKETLLDPVRRLKYDRRRLVNIIQSSNETYDSITMEAYARDQGFCRCGGQYTILISSPLACKIEQPSEQVPQYLQCDSCSLVVEVQNM